MNSIICMRKALGRLSKMMALIGMYTLLIATILVSTDVLGRKLLNLSFIGADELSGYALALATSWGTAYALHLGNHIRIDVFHRLIPIRLRAVLDIFSVLSLLVFAGLMTWYIADLTWESWEFGVVANTPLRVPLWMPQLPWLLGFVPFVISAALILVESLMRLYQGDHEGICSLVDGCDHGLEAVYEDAVVAEGEKV